MAAYGTVARRPGAPGNDVGIVYGYLAEVEADKFFLRRTRPARAPGGDGFSYASFLVRARASAGPLAGPDQWMAEGALGLGVQGSSRILEDGPDGDIEKFLFSTTLEFSFARLSRVEGNEHIYGVRISGTFALVAPFAKHVLPR